MYSCTYQCTVHVLSTCSAPPIRYLSRDLTYSITNVGSLDLGDYHLRFGICSFAGRTPVLRVRAAPKALGGLEGRGAERASHAVAHPSLHPESEVLGRAWPKASAWLVGRSCDVLRKVAVEPKNGHHQTLRDRGCRRVHLSPPKRGSAERWGPRVVNRARRPIKCTRRW